MLDLLGKVTNLCLANTRQGCSMEGSVLNAHTCSAVEHIVLRSFLCRYDVNQGFTYHSSYPYKTVRTVCELNHYNNITKGSSCLDRSNVLNSMISDTDSC